MGNFVRDAGWGIWPVLLFGALGLVLAVRHAMSPSREQLSLVVGLAIATVLFGMLGAVVGVQTSIGAVASAAATTTSTAPPGVFLLGLRESLNNVVAALLFASVHALVGTYGTYRLARGVPLVS